MPKNNTQPMPLGTSPTMAQQGQGGGSNVQQVGPNGAAVRMGPNGKPQHKHPGYQDSKGNLKWHNISQRHGSLKQTQQMHQQAGLGKDGYGGTRIQRESIGASMNEGGGYQPAETQNQFQEFSESHPKLSKLGRVAGTLGIAALDVGAETVGRAMNGITSMIQAVLSGNPLSPASTAIGQTIEGMAAVSDNVDNLYAKYGIAPGIDPKVLDGTIKGKKFEEEQELMNMGYNQGFNDVDEIIGDVIGYDVNTHEPMDISNASDTQLEEIRRRMADKANFYMDQLNEGRENGMDEKQRKALVHTLEVYQGAFDSISTQADANAKKYRQEAKDIRSAVAYGRAMARENKLQQKAAVDANNQAMYDSSDMGMRTMWDALGFDRELNPDLIPVNDRDNARVQNMLQNRIDSGNYSQQEVNEMQSYLDKCRDFIKAKEKLAQARARNAHLNRDLTASGYDITMGALEQNNLADSQAMDQYGGFYGPKKTSETERTIRRDRARRFSGLVRNYMAQGMSKEDAQKKAMQDVEIQRSYCGEYLMNKVRKKELALNLLRDIDATWFDQNGIDPAMRDRAIDVIQHRYDMWGQDHGYLKDDQGNWNGRVPTARERLRYDRDIERILSRFGLLKKYNLAVTGGANSAQQPYTQGQPAPPPGGGRRQSGGNQGQTGIPTGTNGNNQTGGNQGQTVLINGSNSAGQPAQMYTTRPPNWNQGWIDVPKGGLGQSDDARRNWVQSQVGGNADGSNPDVQYLADAYNAIKLKSATADMENLSTQSRRNAINKFSQLINQLEATNSPEDQQRANILKNYVDWAATSLAVNDALYGKTSKNKGWDRNAVSKYYDDFLKNKGLNWQKGAVQGDYGDYMTSEQEALDYLVNNFYHPAPRGRPKAADNPSETQDTANPADEDALRQRWQGYGINPDRPEQLGGQGRRFGIDGVDEFDPRNTANLDLLDDLGLFNPASEGSGSYNYDMKLIPNRIKELMNSPDPAQQRRGRILGNYYVDRLHNQALNDARKRVESEKLGGEARRRMDETIPKGYSDAIPRSSWLNADPNDTTSLYNPDEYGDWDKKRSLLAQDYYDQAKGARITKPNKPIKESDSTNNLVWEALASRYPKEMRANMPITSKTIANGLADMRDILASQGVSDAYNPTANPYKLMFERYNDLNAKGRVDKGLDKYNQDDLDQISKALDDFEDNVKKAGEQDYANIQQKDKVPPKEQKLIEQPVGPVETTETPGGTDIPPKDESPAETLAEPKEEVQGGNPEDMDIDIRNLLGNIDPSKLPLETRSQMGSISTEYERRFHKAFLNDPNLKDIPSDPSKTYAELVSENYDKASPETQALFDDYFTDMAKLVDGGITGDTTVQEAVPQTSGTNEAKEMPRPEKVESSDVLPGEDPEQIKALEDDFTDLTIPPGSGLTDEEKAKLEQEKKNNKKPQEKDWTREQADAFREELDKKFLSPENISGFKLDTGAKDLDRARKKILDSVGGDTRKLSHNDAIRLSHYNAKLSSYYDEMLRRKELSKNAYKAKKLYLNDPQHLNEATLDNLIASYGALLNGVKISDNLPEYETKEYNAWKQAYDTLTEMRDTLPTQRKLAKLNAQKLADENNKEEVPAQKEAPATEVPKESKSDVLDEIKNLRERNAKYRDSDVMTSSEMRDAYKDIESRLYELRKIPEKEMSHFDQIELQYLSTKSKEYQDAMQARQDLRDSISDYLHKPLSKISSKKLSKYLNSVKEIMVTIGTDTEDTYTPEQEKELKFWEGQAFLITKKIGEKEEKEAQKKASVKP